jgi:CrcB protein
MSQLIAVFIGSGCGAVIRWLCQSRWNPDNGWPLGTFIVNMCGALLAGVCLALAARLSEATRLFVVTGILGGLTTFSALSAETFALGMQGFMVHAVSYGLCSLILGALVCWFGYWIVVQIGVS